MEMFGILDMVLLIAAVYIGYQWYCLQVQGEIKTGLLLNKEVNVNKCLDKEAYRREASPALLILMIATFVEAGLNMGNSFLGLFPMWLLYGGIVVYLGVLVWFTGRSRKLYEKYWDTSKKSIKR